MHAFCELVQHSTAFSLNALDLANQRAVHGLQSSGATALVRVLQMVQLQKVIAAVGMFSMFDATLQNELLCRDGFRKAAELLEANDKAILRERFIDLQLAINVLKHGKGRSYDVLLQKAASLPFRVKLPDETFFNEGDVSEVSTLIQVDDAFVQLCADVIHDVSLNINLLGKDGI